MDQTNKPGRIDQTYRLLALCARTEGHSAFYGQLARQTNQFTAWDQLPFQAVLHGMAPLLWHHIRQSGVAIPDKTARTLKGLYLRQRLLNRAYTLAMIDVISLFQRNGILALVLKGPALAYEYYPDPALRPFNDIDLLLEQKDILHGLHLLSEAGFSVRLPTTALNRLSTELTADSPLKDGLRVHFELHYYNPRERSDKDNSLDHEFEGFDSLPHTLMIENGIVYVPAPMDNLRYLSIHLARHLLHTNDRKPLQLKWVADIVSLVEKNVESLDWARMHRHNPEILERLEVFYSLTSLPEYTRTFPIKQLTPPLGVNQYPKGWPEHHFRDWKKVGFLRFLGWTFSPPTDWWLRLYYGVSVRVLPWYRQIVYRMSIPGLMYRVLINETYLSKIKLHGPRKQP